MVCLCKGCDGCCVFCCFVTRGAVGARVGIGKYECYVMQMLYVCVLCTSCGSFQCCILHNLQFVEEERGDNIEEAYS